MTPLKLSNDFNARTARDHLTCLEWWQACPEVLPAPIRRYTEQARRHNDTRLDALIEGALKQAKRPPRTPGQWRRLEEELGKALRELGTEGVGFSDGQVDSLENEGFSAAARDFFSRARAFDPALTIEDLFQASRNVWSMNFFQRLMGLPVRVTPSVFAYSLLYPYSDNLLDDRELSPARKLAFSERFRARLAGERLEPAGPLEARIYELVGMVEGEHPRATTPDVYASLLAIHDAQTRSLRLMSGAEQVGEPVLLDIAFEKGGTSVLADGYLVAGALTPDQALFLYAYGCFTQLMDDQEDTQVDRQAGIQTLFTRQAQAGRFDALTCQTMQYARRVLPLLDGFGVSDAQPLKDFIRESIDLLLVDAVGRMAAETSPDFLEQVADRLPFSFTALARAREQTERHAPVLRRLAERYPLSAVAATLETGRL